MDAGRFTGLSLAAFGLILVSFVLLGFGRIVLPYRIARLVAAPTTLLSAVLVGYLLVRSVPSVLGISRIE
jgi:hypothetical protein